MAKNKKGGYSIEGFRYNSKDKNNDYNIIPSNRISMAGVEFPVQGIDNTGYAIAMYPGGEYTFPGHTVYEQRMQKGGMFWDGTRFKKATGSTNWSGNFYQQGGPYDQSRDFDPIANSSNPMYQDYGDMYSADERFGLMYKPQSTQDWGMGDPGNLMHTDYSGFSGAPTGPTGYDMSPAADYDSSYSIDAVRRGEAKKGGIHIAKNKVGTFTAAASKHGKGVQEFASQVLAHKENYSPAMIKKANFARNASKWHHEYGGPANPLHKFMQAGGKVDVNGNPIGPWGGVNSNNVREELPFNTPFGSPSYAPMDDIMQGRDVEQQRVQNDPNAAPLVMMDDYNAQQYKNQAVSPQYATNDQPVQVNMDNGQYSPAPRRRGPNPWAGLSNSFNNLLGAGLMTASYFNNMKSDKDRAAWAQRQGLSSNMPHIQNPGGHGDYSQQGSFRPDMRTPTKAGAFYPHYQQGGPIGDQPLGLVRELDAIGYDVAYLKAGGIVNPNPVKVPVSELDAIGWRVAYLQDGGAAGPNPRYYKQGGVYDMSEDEIRRLNNMGYEVEYL